MAVPLFKQGIAVKTEPLFKQGLKLQSQDPFAVQQKKEERRRIIDSLNAPRDRPSAKDFFFPELKKVALETVSDFFRTGFKSVRGISYVAATPLAAGFEAIDPDKTITPRQAAFSGLEMAREMFLDPEVEVDRDVKKAAALYLQKRGIRTADNKETGKNPNVLDIGVLSFLGFANLFGDPALEFGIGFRAGRAIKEAALFKKTGKRIVTLPRGTTVTNDLRGAVIDIPIAGDFKIKIKPKKREVVFEGYMRRFRKPIKEGLPVGEPKVKPDIPTPKDIDELAKEISDTTGLEVKTKIVGDDLIIKPKIISKESLVIKTIPRPTISEIQPSEVPKELEPLAQEARKLETRVDTQEGRTIIKEINEKAGGFITEKQIPGLVEKLGEFAVVVKDVNGQRAVMNVSDFQTLSTHRAFSDRIRAVWIPARGAEPVKQPNIDADFMSELQIDKLLADERKPLELGTLESIEGIKLTNNSTVSKQGQQKFVAMITNNRIRNFLKENGIKEVNIQPPYRFGLSEQASVTPSKKIININADATDPSKTILHELGHVKFESLSLSEKGILIEKAKQTENPGMQGYKKIEAWEEIIADSLYKDPNFAPEIYNQAVGGEKKIKPISVEFEGKDIPIIGEIDSATGEITYSPKDEITPVSVEKIAEDIPTGKIPNIIRDALQNKTKKFEYSTGSFVGTDKRPLGVGKMTASEFFNRLASVDVEFAENPQFVVKENKLVFQGETHTTKINPDILGLKLEDLQEGMTIKIKPSKNIKGEVTAEIDIVSVAKEIEARYKECN